MVHRLRFNILQRLLAFIGLGVLFLAVWQASAWAIARGYTTTDSGLQTGMVVSLSLTPSTSSAVERATQDSSNRVVGIATTVNDSSVSVNSAGSKVLVEADGPVDAYVSDIGGSIHKGDLLIVSPLKGILMKGSQTGSAVIVAVATTEPGTATTYSYQDNGKTKQTNIAKLSVSINHTGGGNNGQNAADNSLPRIGRAIVGKEVSEIRVIIAMIILFIVLIVVGGIVYGAVSSGITALGRNPLASKIIRRQLMRIIMIALLILILGLGTVYGILWI